MSAWLLSLVGTPLGGAVAMALALMAAVLHALFGALQKGRHGPWLARAAIDASYGLMAAPFALFVVPWPEPHMWPVFAGAFVAGYTTYDAWGIRATADPFTFLAWFFMVDGVFIPVVTFRRWRGLTVGQMAPLLKRGVFGAFVAYFSFGGIMLATRIGRVGEAAALRETSVIFAALIGWWVLGEKTGPVQVGLMAVIAAGAVVVEFGG